MNPICTVYKEQPKIRTREVPSNKRGFRGVSFQALTVQMMIFKGTDNTPRPRQLAGTPLSRGEF